jgi:hypothetical protein
VSGFALPPFVAATALAFFVFAAAIVGHGLRDDRRWRNAIDSHHARTGLFPTLADLSRPRARSAVAPVPAPAPVLDDAPQWWLLECPTCDLIAPMPGTLREIQSALDHHNLRVHSNYPEGENPPEWARGWAA